MARKPPFQINLKLSVFAVIKRLLDYGIIRFRRVDEVSCYSFLPSTVHQSTPETPSSDLVSHGIVPLGQSVQLRFL